MNLEQVIQLKPEEEILMVNREVVLPRLPKILLLALWFLLPFFFLFPLFRIGWIGVVLFLLLVIPAAVFLFRAYRTWSDTLLIITDLRVVDVERRGLFDTEVCEASHADIDEVTFRIKGFFPTLLRYGVVEMKVAGAAADIEFRRLKQPAKVHDLIADLRRGVREPDADPRERRLRQIAKRATMNDIEAVDRHLRDRDRDEAVKEFLDEA
jgi:hypothetical protein